MMRTMLALRLSGYGRETKRPAIGYGQRPENSQRADGWAEVWADGWGEGEYGFKFVRGGRVKPKVLLRKHAFARSRKRRSL